jgi:hypothetical protein
VVSVVVSVCTATVDQRHKEEPMKVRGTTSFSVDVDAPVAPQAVIEAVQQAVATFQADYQQVLEAHVQHEEPTAPEADLMVDLNIVFRSGSYAEVETAMNDLRDRLRNAVSAASAGAKLDGRETQLVPA